MKKSDILICGFMYCFSFFFLYLTLDFPAEARHYPHFIIGLLLILTTVRMSHMFRDYRRDHRVINDMGELFEGFLPGQFRSMFIYFILFFVQISLALNLTIIYHHLIHSSIVFCFFITFHIIFICFLCIFTCKLGFCLNICKNRLLFAK